MKSLCRPTLIILLAAVSSASFGQSLRNLANLREGVKRQRISSYDRTGGNRRLPAQH